MRLNTRLHSPSTHQSSMILDYHPAPGRGEYPGVPSDPPSHRSIGDLPKSSSPPVRQPAGMSIPIFSLATRSTRCAVLSISVEGCPGGLGSAWRRVPVAAGIWLCVWEAVLLPSLEGPLLRSGAREAWAVCTGGPVWACVVCLHKIVSTCRYGEKGESSRDVLVLPAV
jgi:hypothetical protein